MRLLKAEILITRRCNLSCSYCKIPKTIPKSKELNLSEWKKVFDIVYEELGASFIAIYGGEPMCLGKEGLAVIINCLSKYRPKKSYTIISNSIGITDDYINHLIGNGLDSWTASVDTIDSKEEIDKYTSKKTNAGLRALLKMKKKGVRDVCGIVTANHKNLDNIPLTVKFLSDRGIWTSIDVVHYRKCEGQNGLPLKSTISEILFNREDMPRIIDTANKLIGMKNDGQLIFPTFEVLESWKNPNYMIDLNWKCGTVEPCCITIDADGSLMECDSFRGSRIKKYSIFDASKTWKKLSSDFMEDVSMECTGCFWSTHFCAEKILTNNDERYYQHETTREDSSRPR